MKLSNEIIVNSANALSQLSLMELPVKVSYAIAKNINKIEKELKVYNAERQKLIQKYAVKGTDGKPKVDENGTMNIQEGFLENWNKDTKELSAIENEIDIHLIKLDDLFNCPCNISASILAAVEYMIEE